ncbi:hypothetical protein THZG08_520018 [Vibrio owensii]|uniref:Uncharacterized protein n=1 Tax=Vibrio owensii TaxID=696485 RepID=A0AAU9Q2D5_9VIBR|nr:hypothetical protein THF1D04_130107 [Vibrio owensii]CAH1568841.1 hypothetical protein THOE12_250023 [Vibrio rotiferianus]CAH1535836.1 hypothetical protein THZG08_520018 [Vibrio owensii]CAH1574032.1 hypothetical protein THZB04_220022 [Vibrio owensii]CAH1584548.1 hypothetical protein THOA03_520018 [Vibrio owensii]
MQVFVELSDYGSPKANKPDTISPQFICCTYTTICGAILLLTNNRIQSKS